MKISEIQTLIFERTGLKTTARHNKGSMKGYITIRPMFQGGEYAQFPIEFAREIKSKFKTFGDNYPICGTQDINIPIQNITEFDPIRYKKENKPKPIEETKQRSWGSKNSQLRLDKATARNAVKMQKGNTARYY